MPSEEHTTSSATAVVASTRSPPRSTVLAPAMDGCCSAATGLKCPAPSPRARRWASRECRGDGGNHYETYECRLRRDDCCHPGRALRRHRLLCQRRQRPDDHHLLCRLHRPESHRTQQFADINLCEVRLPQVLRRTIFVE